ncbi:MAG: hypothetical protein K2H09_04525, partial [Treponemataceae bacterium]|nr:hypothetical protein [Treponemataceae bacterium]
CGQGHDNCYSVKCLNFSAIASNDSGFSSPTSEMYKASIKGANDTGESYAACRDLDHTNAVVQKEIIGWLNDVLKPAGFVGWRYDFVKGFGGQYVGQYNAGSSAEFSVGEYWPTAGFSASNPGAWGTEIKNWISATAGGGMRSRAFDFALKGILNSVFGCNTSNAANGSYALLADKASLMQSQPADAVTFIDNHDTGSTQAHWYLDPADVGAAYALILTHPGYPCVAWQHYFTDAESGGHSESQYIGGSAVPGTKKTYRAHIDSLIALRKAVGIEYDSALNVEAATSSVYAAKVSGTNGELAVAIGSGWTPDGDGYAGNNPVYSGTNFKIWQKGASGEEGGGTEAVTFICTSSPGWDITSSNPAFFAWCWGGSAGSGVWHPASADSSGTTTFSAPSDITNFLIVRCITGTTTPDWNASGSTPGTIWNKTEDVTVSSGTTTYSVKWN